MAFQDRETTVEMICLVSVIFSTNKINQWCIYLRPRIGQQHHLITQKHQPDVEDIPVLEDEADQNEH